MENPAISKFALTRRIFDKIFAMRLLALFCICALIACTPAENAELAKLEQEVADNSTNANVSELLEMYDTWLAEHPEADTKRKEVLIKAYNLSDKHIRYNQQIEAIRQLVIDYPDDPENPDRLLKLATIYDKMRRTPAAIVIRKEFQKAFPDHEAIPGLREARLPAISTDTFLTQLAVSMSSDSLAPLNQNVASQYVDAAEAYALVNHGDTSSVKYLHNAAQTARTLRSYNRAIDIFDWILEKYPTHPKAPQALFLKAFTYDNEFGDIEKAREYYLAFIENCPEDEFADDAQFLLDNLGKSDDELLRELQEKAEQTKTQQ